MDSWKPAPSLTNSAHVAWGGTCGLLASTARNAYLVAFGIVTFLLEAGRLDKTSFFLILVGFRHFSPMLAGAFIREDVCVFFVVLCIAFEACCFALAPRVMKSYKP